MQQSQITIDVHLDADKVPQQISWGASNSNAGETQKAKAMMLAFWDGQEKSALRIDLWTKDMMIDEMADFYYQTLMGMADTYLRATQQQQLCDDMKNFAREFYRKFRETQKEQ